MEPLLVSCPHLLTLAHPKDRISNLRERSRERLISQDPSASHA